MVGGMAVQHLWLSKEEKQKQKQGSKEKMMSKTDPQKHLATRKPQRERRARGRGKQPGSPMLDVRRATFSERALQLGQRWTAVPNHYGVDVVATRKFSRTGSSTMKLLASQAIQRKRQGKERM